MNLPRFLLAILGLTTALPATAVEVDFSRSWFQPELEINNTPICEQLLQHTKSVLSGESEEVYPASFTKEPHSNRRVLINGKDVYLGEYRLPGCCQYQLMAATEAFPSQRDDEKFYSQRIRTSPPAGGFLFLSLHGDYFALTKNNQENVLFQLDENANWDKVCAVRKTPSKEQIASTNGDFEKTQEVLSLLRSLVGQLRQGAGDCGSNHTHYRWGMRITEEFGNLLHAPKLQPKIQQHHDDSTFEADLENLKLWSLQGIGEFESLKQFQESMVIALRELSWFYKTHFKWDKTQADAIADYALKYAISSGIRFYMYEPFKTTEEILLRRAILENKPITEIKSIDISAIDKSPDNSSYSKSAESVLSIAVKHPEATRYLLESGFDPNHKNGFHKTPLMYAAQHNGLAAAKELIKYGAELNVGTIIPPSRCAYILKTSNMSPLHYAVRYSDRALIDLLLDEGASKYHNVTNLRNSFYNRIEYPITWLSRFENPLLSEQDRQHIEDRLKLPSEEERKKLSKSITIQGEQLYKEKFYSEAAAKFNNASEIDDSNVRAINNHALTLLKLGDKERSLEVSRKVIQSTAATEKERASAYFNTGLACEGAKHYGIHFNGNMFCKAGAISEYVAAYRSYPTSSRANTITERLLSKEANPERLCVSDDKRFEAVYKLDYNKLIFLHRVPMEDALTDISNHSRKRKSTEIIKQQVELKRAVMEDLKNGHYLSIYISNVRLSEDFEMAEGVCTTDSTELIPESDYTNKP